MGLLSKRPGILPGLMQQAIDSAGFKPAAVFQAH